MIKIGIDPDGKARYIKLAKNTVIASILITLSLTLLDIPKDYFGTPIGIADEEIGEVTFAKIEDKDCQNREVVTINGKRFVVTDTNKKIVAFADDEALYEEFGICITDKIVENVCYLRPFSDCQDFWKGYYAKVEYYRDKDGYIFPTDFTYKQYMGHKNSNRRWHG